MNKILIIGSLNVDMTINLDHSPKPGETVSANELVYNNGGKGANQACAVGKISKYGATMYGSVGNDFFKDNILKGLDKCNVDRKHINVVKDTPTGLAVVSIDKFGENSIIVCPNANQYTNLEYIHGIEETIKEFSYIILQNEIPLATNLYLMKLANKLGVKVIYNPAPALANFPVEGLKYVDYLTPNQTELNILVHSEGTIDDKAHELLKLGVKNVIVTQGSYGVFFKNISESYQVPAFKVKAIDTVAAGDTFNGAFTVGIASGKSVKDSLVFANAASAIAVQRQGAIDSIPSLEEVNEFLRKRNEE